MAFKLRSGNNAPFKQVGGDKETNAQYNARVKAEYEAQLQSHSDSTASYKNQLEKDKLQLDNADLWNARNARQNILGFETSNFAFNKEEREEYAKQRRVVFGQQQKLARENYNRGIYSKFNLEEGFEVGSTESGGSGISPNSEAFEGPSGRWESRFPKGYGYKNGEKDTSWRPWHAQNNAEETEKLKPKSVPKPPVYRNETTAPVKPKGDLRKPVATTLEKVPSIRMKNIDMGQVAEPQPTKALPYELVKNNAKYFTAEMKGKRGGSYIKGEDGKSEINLKDQAGNTVFTGSQTEFTEKYGDVLKRGSKKYGQEDREDRFYINR